MILFLLIIAIVFGVAGYKYASKQPESYHEQRRDEMKSAAVGAVVGTATVIRDVIKDGK